MREIKFRAWDNKGKKMYFCNPDTYKEDSSNNVAFANIRWIWGRFKDIIPMQFTGLRDKNGKEIYEGDIIRETYSDGSGCRDFEVSFGDNEAVAGVSQDDDDEYNIDARWIGWHFRWIGHSGFEMIDDISFYNTEVVGNVYENPDLLKNRGD